MTTLTYGPDPAHVVIVALAILVLATQAILARYHGRNRP